MIEVTIIIPTADNDGVSFTPETFKAFEAHATDLVGGISRLQGQLTGRWKGDDGKIYDDKSTVYLVALGSLTDGDKVGTLVSFAKKHFRQEAIYLSYLGRAEII